MDSDEELVRQFQTGSPEAANVAFAELHRRHNAPLLRLLRALGLSHVEAEDVTQDVWVRAFESRLRAFDPARGRLLPWLSLLARNRAAEIRRSRLRSRVVHLESLEAPPEAPPAGPSAEMVLAELLDPLRSPLDERERVLLDLLVAQVPTGEICERMNLSQPTVWRLRQKILEEGRRLFDDRPGAEG